MSSARRLLSAPLPPSVVPSRCMGWLWGRWGHMGVDDVRKAEEKERANQIIRYRDPSRSDLEMKQRPYT